MGRRGPPPKPTHLRLLEGNPGRRPLNKREPKPKKVVPAKPDWLSPRAGKEWKRVIPLLSRMGVLTEVDGDALTAYCILFARWRETEEFLAEHGAVYPLRTKSGDIKYMAQFPQVAIARDLVRLVRAYQQEFGLTPSARSRIDTGGLEDPSETERFFD